MTAQTYSIPIHWDTAGNITASSDPETEYCIWREHAWQSPDWDGSEFSVKDFRLYIESLKPSIPQEPFRLS